MEHIDLTARLVNLNAANGQGPTLVAKAMHKCGALFSSAGFELLGVLKALLRRVLEYLLSPYVLTCIAVFFVLNRTLVFSATREPVPLSFRRRLLLRGTAIALLSFPSLSLINVVFSGANVDTRRMLQLIQRAFVMNSFIELFSSVVQGKVPIYESGYSFFEFSLIFQDVRSQYSRAQPYLPHDIALMALVAIWAQIATNLMALGNWQRYRLVVSTAVGVVFMAHFIYLRSQGRLWNYPTLGLLAHLRYVPQIAILCVVGTCWSLYWFTVAFVGDRSRMVARRGFVVNMSDSFYHTVFKLGFDVLESSVDQTYLQEAASMYWPLATWIDVMHVNRLESIAATAPDGSVMRIRGSSSNPYANEIANPPRVDNRSVKTMQTRFAQAIPHSLVWMATAYELGRAALTVAFCRLRGAVNSRPGPPPSSTAPPPPASVFCTEMYGPLDKDPQVYRRLLSGATLPEVDDSCDYIPSDDSDNDYDDYDSDLNDNDDNDITDDVSMCAENIVNEGLRRHGDYGMELVAHHMNSPHASTRQNYLDALDPGFELAKIIMERRRGTDLAKCAVCLENQRQVVLWPCRCLALCDECRLTLSARRFKNCVCCQQRVHSFSKLYIP